MRNLWHYAAPTLLVLTGCGGATLETPSGLEPGPDRTATPSISLELPGERVDFLVDEDGSVGVLGASSSGVSVLDNPGLDDKSPAVIFHALSTDPIPVALLKLHAQLVVDGEVPELVSEIGSRPAGWAANLPQALSQPCKNSTFRNRHCQHASYDDQYCRTNVEDHEYIKVEYAHRFKAGYCLQSGQNRAFLFYKQVLACENYDDHGKAFVWGQDSFENNTKYSATTYRSYVWWRPSTALLRVFTHSAGGGTNDVFDFGARYSTSPCGS